MYNWKELLDYINGEIAGMSFERQPAELYAPIRYVLSMGGKRIRPVLMLMAYNLYKEKVEVIRSQAMAIEIYHNYTLLHDDLMDRADMRRGMATVHKKWDDNAAILSGDSMLVMAYRYMQQGCPVEQLGNVMGLFTETALEIGEGQQYDIEFETRADVSERRIYRDDSFEDIRIVGLRAENRGHGWGMPPGRMRSFFIVSARISVWLSSCRMITWMYMATRRSSVRK